jgi:hypothetical protein
MSDDPRKAGLDRKLISLDEEHEVRSWTQSLGCTPEQLREAVRAVGNADACASVSPRKGEVRHA